MKTWDRPLLYASRGLRMFAYGSLSVILALYLAGRGLSTFQIGLLFSVALAGGAVTTFVVTARADRWGRRRTLAASGLLLAAAGLALVSTGNFPLLLLAAVLGSLSPGGTEVGPFQSLEQAALAAVTPGQSQVHAYAWYHMIGSLAGAFGALAGGLIPTALEAVGWAPLAAQQALVWLFVALGLALAAWSLLLSPRVEVPAARASQGTLHRSRGVMLRLSALFSIDFVGGGFLVQSLIAFWFQQRYGVGLAELGALFFGTNLLAAGSSLVAARLADRFGLLRTMVLTHLPSNLLLILVPFMPTWQWAAALLLLRNTASQMDVPTRSAYVMALVPLEEQSAAAGLTNAVRNAAASVAPLFTGMALASAASGLPFIVAGVLKGGYDVALWLTFRRVPLLSADVQIDTDRIVKT